MAYQHHPHNHYAAADGGVLPFPPHQIYTDPYTMSFPAPYAAVAQPELFEPHYIYSEESIFYNYRPDCAAAAQPDPLEPHYISSEESVSYNDGPGFAAAAQPDPLEPQFISSEESVSYNYGPGFASAAQPDPLEPHYIYSEDSISYNYGPGFAAAAQPDPLEPQEPHYISSEDSISYNYGPDFVAATLPDFAAVAQLDPLEPHYIYSGDSVSYNYGGAHPHHHHHHPPAFTQETMAFPPLLNDRLVYNGEEVVVFDDLYEDPLMAPPRQPENGLPEEVVARFLEKMAREDDGDEPELCAVCQDDLSWKIVALGCRHRFHGECIGKWLQMKNSCPLCKAIAIDH